MGYTKNESRWKTRAHSDSGELLAELFREAGASKDENGKPLSSNLNSDSAGERGGLSGHNNGVGHRKSDKSLPPYGATKKSPAVSVRATLVILAGILSVATFIYFGHLDAIQPEPPSGRIGKGSTPRAAPTKQPDKANGSVLGRTQETVLPPPHQMKVQLPDSSSPIPPAEKETESADAQKKDVRICYPYAVYLGSYKTIERARKAVAIYREKGLSPYWVEIDLGSRGVWFRVFAGCFRSRAEAEAFAKNHGLPEGQSRQTRYANLIGTYHSDEELDKMIRTLRELGFFPYAINSQANGFFLFTGAFYNKARADKQNKDLASKGIQSLVVER
jgi:cell division septation protein DedD